MVINTLEAIIETQATGSQNQPVTKQPWEQDWSTASHADLYIARDKATDQTTQNNLADMEHRAFAREAVSANPLMAIPLLAAIPGYQVAKAAGLTHSRSDPSVEQAAEAYKGVGEGLLKPWEKAWGAVKEVVGLTPPVSTDVTNGPWSQNFGSTSALKPHMSDGNWEEVDKRYKATQGQRNQAQLDILKGELMQETNPKNIEVLKREIGRSEKLVKGNKNG